MQRYSRWWERTSEKEDDDTHWIPPAQRFSAWPVNKLFLLVRTAVFGPYAERFRFSSMASFGGCFSPSCGRFSSCGGFSRRSDSKNSAATCWLRLVLSAVSFTACSRVNFERWGGTYGFFFLSWGPDSMTL